MDPTIILAVVQLCVVPPGSFYFDKRACVKQILTCVSQELEADVTTPKTLKEFPLKLAEIARLEGKALVKCVKETK